MSIERSADEAHQHESKRSGLPETTRSFIKARTSTMLRLSRKVYGFGKALLGVGLLTPAPPTLSVGRNRFDGFEPPAVTRGHLLCHGLVGQKNLELLLVVGLVEACVIVGVFAAGEEAAYGPYNLSFAIFIHRSCWITGGSGRVCVLVPASFSLDDGRRCGSGGRGR